jgi:hypothetical protein
MTDSEAISLRQTGWLEFPLQSIIGRRGLEDVTSRFVWISIPLEYYLLTRFTGGIESLSLPIVVVALLTIVVVIGISCAMALFQFHDELSYSTRVRVWAVTLMLQWVTCLVLLSCGYLIGAYFGVNYDVMYLWLRNIPAFGSYPFVADLRTFAIYACYSLLAAILLRSAGRYLGIRRFPSDLPRAPNLLLVIPLAASIMMVMHGITRLY